MVLREGGWGKGWVCHLELEGEEVKVAMKPLNRGLFSLAPQPISEQHPGCKMALEPAQMHVIPLASNRICTKTPALAGRGACAHSCCKYPVSAHPHPGRRETEDCTPSVALSNQALQSPRRLAGGCLGARSWGRWKRGENADGILHRGTLRS